MSPTSRVVIVGADLAGLAFACRLTQAGLACTVLQSGDEVGGRVRTDRMEGFRLDRGFQVLLTGYPEEDQTLDMASLGLHPFRPGAMVRHGGQLHRVSDPLRRPQDLLQSLLAPSGRLRTSSACYASGTLPCRNAFSEWPEAPPAGRERSHGPMAFLTRWCALLFLPSRLFL